MEKPRHTCPTCNREFINLKSHQRKTHDYFNVSVENNTPTVYKNGRQFAVFTRMLDGWTGREEATNYAKMYDNEGDFGVSEGYYRITIYPNNEFAVFDKHCNTIIGRRRIVAPPPN